MNNIEIARDFQKYLDANNITQQTVANATDISQSFISRIRNGDFKRITDKVKMVCEYASISLEADKKHSSAEKEILTNAIDYVWDGTEKQAKALAKVIRSLKLLT